MEIDFIQELKKRDENVCLILMIISLSCVG